MGADRSTMASAPAPKLGTYAGLILLVVVSDQVALRVADALGQLWLWIPIQMALLLPFLLLVRRRRCGPAEPDRSVGISGPGA